MNSVKMMKNVKYGGDDSDNEDIASVSGSSSDEEESVVSVIDDIDEDEEEEAEVEEEDADVEEADEDDDDDKGAGVGDDILPSLNPVLDSDDDEDEMDESYLQKFNASVNKNYIQDYHPECVINNYDEISALTKIVRDQDNNIIDDLHRTLPYLTKYERARVLGQRAKQINSGAKVFVKVPENVIDGYLIAEIELAQKRIPFIIRRPTPGGGCEYWNLRDLELIQY